MHRPSRSDWLGTGRCSFFVVWGLSVRSHREKGHFLFRGLSPPRFFLHLPPPYILEHLNRCRGIPGVVIVGIGVDLDLPLVDLPEDFRPFRQFLPAINDHFVPYLRLLLNSFTVTEPAHVSEVGGDGVKPLEPLRESG